MRAYTHRAQQQAQQQAGEYYILLHKSASARGQQTAWPPPYHCIMLAYIFNEK